MHYYIIIIIIHMSFNTIMHYHIIIIIIIIIHMSFNTIMHTPVHTSI